MKNKITFMEGNYKYSNVPSGIANSIQQRKWYKTKKTIKK